MNKRELIKALFKDPTIKALYESGHFDATDINRAILSETEETNAAPSAASTSTDNTENSGDETTSDTNYSDEEKKEYRNLAKLVLKANALINKPEFVEKQGKFLKDLDDENFLEELVFTYLKLSNNTDQTNAAQELIKKYRADESIKPLQQQIAKLKASLGKIQGKSTTPSEEPSNVSVNEYVDGLANEFDEKVSKVLQLELANLYSDKSLTTAKAFIMYAIGSKEKLQESEKGGQTDLFMSQKVDPFLADAGLSDDSKAKEFLNNIVSSAKIQDLYGEVEKEINLPQDDVPTDDSTEADLKQKRQQLANRASAALSVLNIENSELLKNDVFMIFMGSVLEKEGVIREAEEQLESYVEKYLPQLENEETRKEFYITQEEVGGLKTFLETNKDNVDKIITAAIKATKDNKDPSMDDESPPDLAEFQENWTEVLMTFFGKNPKKSSFMRRLLLSSQAEMLYGVIKVLQDISDPEKMAAYTDMNQDDEREKKAEKPETSDGTPAQPANSETGAEENPTVNTENLQRENEEFEDPQSDKVELPPKTRRIIKQDLQSMVDLLRQVKKAIGSYSQYSTQKSGDPRFDGSTLKKDMDNLLAQVQDDIYDLWSNLKPAELPPEEEEGNLDEALSGIVLEDADPERQEKIKLVREVYDNAKEEYIYTLMPSMKGNDWGKSQTSAKQILEILKKDEFISLFPTVTKTTSGRVMTLGEAHDSMKQIIQEFIETVRDIVLISKTKYISSTSLTQAKRNLFNISREIATLFRVPSKFSTDEIKQAKEEEATKPENQSITPEPAENLEQGSEDNNPGPTPPEGTEPDDQQEEPSPRIDTIESNKKFFTYIESNKVIKKIESVNGRNYFVSFAQEVLEGLLDQQIDEGLNDLKQNYMGKFRSTYKFDLGKVINNIMNSSKPPKGLKVPLSDALDANSASLLKYFNVEELTKLIVDFIESEKIFTLLDENKLATSFTSLATLLDMDSEGTLEPNAVGKNPLKQGYINKITSKQYPEGMPDSSLAAVLHKALGGDLGNEIADHFNKKIKSLFTLKQKDPTNYNPEEDTEDLGSYLFDPISKINVLSNLKGTYGKYVSLYLANVYEQFATKSLFNNQKKSKISDSHENAYGKTIEDENNLDSFIKKYNKAYGQFKMHFNEIDGRGKELNDFIIDVLDANTATQRVLNSRSDDEEAKAFMGKLRKPEEDPILELSNDQIFQLAKTIKKAYPTKDTEVTDPAPIEEALKPIIESMLKEQYNY